MNGSARLLTLLSLTLAACSAPATKAEKRAESGPAASEPKALSAASPQGVWHITALNGKPMRTFPGSENTRSASLSIADASVGVYAGCNGGGGPAVVADGRLYVGGIMATQMGCGDLLAQEEAVFGILASQPRLILASDGSGRLESAKGTLTLAADPKPVPVDANAPPFDHRALLAGSQWLIQAIDGEGPKRTQRDQMTLRFDAQRWTVQPLDCAMIGGQWQQGDGTVRLTADPDTAIPACAAAAVTALTSAPLTYRVGFNGEWVAAGGGHWLNGERDRLGEPVAAMQGMTGQWRLSAIDDQPVGSSPARTLTFDGGGYYLDDGCMHSEGIYLMRGAALFVRASGMVTAANCPRDAVAHAFRAGVVNGARVAFGDGDRMVLVRREGTLTFTRSGTAQGGGGTTTRLSPGMRIRLDGDDGVLHLTDARRFTLTLACGTIAGDWNNRRDPAQFSLGGSAPPACENTAQFRRLGNTLSGPVQARIGPNRDIILLLTDHGVAGGTIER